MTVAGAVPVPGATCPAGHALVVETHPLSGEAYEVCDRGEYVVALRGRRPPDTPRVRSRVRINYRTWTEAERERVRRRVRAGQRVPEIARVLHRSQAAIRHMIDDAGGLKVVRAQGRRR